VKLTGLQGVSASTEHAWFLPPLCQFVLCVKLKQFYFCTRLSSFDLSSHWFSEGEYV
jgi:hypothetical protein